MAASGAVHGTVVLADSQTNGRGRRGRPFFSPFGHGIYMSIVLRSQFFPFSMPTLTTIFTAVAVCEAIESIIDDCEYENVIINKKPRIKWVNDIYINEKKVCGILTEVAQNAFVVGIGINFTVPKGGYPTEISPKAGALFNAKNAIMSKNKLVAYIINHLDCPISSDLVLAKYKERLMMLGRPIMVQGTDISYTATALDINNNGNLIVQRDTGQIQTLVAEEISIIV